jgi:ATP-dependent DNA ligase
MSIPKPTLLWPGSNAYRSICGDPGWVAERKVDGWRVRVATGMEASITTRRGASVWLPDVIAQLTHGAPCVFDGELQYAERYLWLFDILAIAHVNVTQIPFEWRRRMLVQAAPVGTRVSLVEQCEKAGAMDRARSQGWEGIVFKRLSSPYPIGNRTVHWRKCLCST